MGRISTGKRKASSESPEEGATPPPSTQTQSFTQSQSQSQSQKRPRLESQSEPALPFSGSASQSQIESQLETQVDSADYPAQPRNLKLPETIVIEKRTEGTTRIVAWNVCGLAACTKKGFKSYVEAEDPDILILTETKMNNASLDPFLNRFPHRYWSFASKAGYAGTAIFSKIEPREVTYILPDHPNKDVVKGRLVTFEFENLWLIGTYVVNAGEKLKTLPVKDEWNVYFEKYIHSLDKTKPVIWAGDLNVAPTEIDLSNAKKKWNKAAGYTASETGAYARILKGPKPEIPTSQGDTDGAQPPISGRLVDVWRDRHPTWQHYSYWGFRGQCRHKGIGWRLDMFVVSERLMPRVKDCWIRDEIYGASDHCPIVLDLEGSL